MIDERAITITGHIKASDYARTSKRKLRNLNHTFKIISAIALAISLIGGAVLLWR